MRILLISSSYNGLCQRAHVELEALGHDISITLALSPEDIRRAVTLFQPDLIICPFLKEKIPEEVWKEPPNKIDSPSQIAKSTVVVVGVHGLLQLVASKVNVCGQAPSFICTV